MPAEPFPPVFLLWWTLLGLFVGSFSNVAIHRHSIEGESVSHPRRSRCPSCRHELSWRENVPLVSWLWQRGRCRHCGWRIPARYPLVELASAGLWLLAALAAPPGSWEVALVHSLVLSGLLVASVVDLDCWEIPDEVSIGGMVLAPLAAFLVPELHAGTAVARAFSEGGEVDRLGAATSALAGVAVGAGILLAVAWIGARVFRKEAMGLGDVKLLGAGGGFIGAGGVFSALMLAAVVTSVAGLGNMLRYLCLSRSRARARGRRDPFGRSLRIARAAGSYIRFGPGLSLGIAVVLLASDTLARLLGGLYA